MDETGDLLDFPAINTIFKAQQYAFYGRLLIGGRGVFGKRRVRAAGYDGDG